MNHYCRTATQVRARAEQREASRKKMSESLGATALGEGALLFHNEHVHTTGVTGLALFAATEDGVQVLLTPANLVTG
jgi:hypothetical protein